MKNCCKCTEDIPCENCDKLINQKKDFSTNLNELKRQAPNEFGYMLPKYVTT